jgi:hypothetical protein
LRFAVINIRANAGAAMNNVIQFPTQSRKASTACEARPSRPKDLQIASGERIHLLSILAHRSDGATEHELVTHDVRGGIIYEAVLLNLVRVKEESAFGQTAYRFEILPAGIQLLGVCKNDRSNTR